MNRRSAGSLLLRWLLITAMLGLAAAGRSPSLAQGGERVALVIGNGAYATSPLPNCAADAAAMEAALRRLGFAVERRTDLDRRGMIERVRAFGTRARAAAVALFYYSGHGVQVDGRNYLVPVGADIRREADVELEAVDVARVLNELSAARPRCGLLILDACRDNPLPAQVKDLRKGLAVKSGPSGSLVAFAASDGQTALAPEDAALSVYTEELLRHLETPGVGLETVFRRTRQGVLGRTGGKQEPEERSKLLEEVVLAAGPRAGSAPVTRNARDGAEMVYVPPGSFLMGSETGRDDEKPVRRVTLTRGFRLYRTEVTNAQYALFLAANPGHAKPEHWNDPRFNAPEQPVVGVSWDDAKAYCDWAGCRLPTEAEWEYAARGSDGREYPWGSQPPDAARAVFGQDVASGRPEQAGRLPAGASPFGALDMAGNVSEWCADCYAPYRPGDAVDPSGAAGETPRVLRGGSWSYPSAYLRAAHRSYGPPGFRSGSVGFRPARTE